MGYPSGVFSPTAKSNGQNIEAAHVNDLQTEVTAIENALLGTITHSVNVSGASTFATVQAGASTFTVRPVMPPPEMALVTSSGVNFTNNTSLAIPWVIDTFLPNSSMHSTGTNPSFLIPQSTGLYQIVAQVGLNNNFGAATGVLRIVVMDSSGAALARSTPVNPTFAVSGQAIGFKRFDQIGSTNWVRVEATVRDSSTHSLSSESYCVLQKL